MNESRPKPLPYVCSECVTPALSLRSCKYCGEFSMIDTSSEASIAFATQLDRQRYADRSKSVSIVSGFVCVLGGVYTIWATYDGMDEDVVDFLLDYTCVWITIALLWYGAFKVLQLVGMKLFGPKLIGPVLGVKTLELKLPSDSMDDTSFVAVLLKALFRTGV